MEPQETARIWDTALGELQLQVTRPYYETYLKDTVGLECREDKFIVGVPTTFGVEWLRQRMQPRVEDVLRGILKRPIPVEFLLRQEHTPLESSSADDEVSAPPPRGSRSRGLNPRYTFESFVVNEFNQMAYAAARSVTDAPGLTYNPLFVYGTVGLGKTHLLHAIGHAVDPHMRVLYASAEQFTNDLVAGIKTKSTEGFRAKYRELDVLLLDDIQFISAKEQTQEGFYHTFNHLHNYNKQIVLAADCHPGRIPAVHERLVSRFEGGLLADIRTPDLEARVEMLTAKTEAMGLQLSEEVIEAIARRARGSIRQLEGALHRVVTYAAARDSDFTAELAFEALQGATDIEKRNVSAEEIVEMAARHFDLSPDELYGKRRHKKLVAARDIAIFLLHEELGMSAMGIGALLGHRTPTSVAASCRRVSAKLSRDDTLKRVLSLIREAV